MVLIKRFVLAALAATVAARSAVIDLIPSNFDDVVLKSGKPTLVEFFAPWCGHCKKLAPIWEELAIALEHANDKIQIAKVDADAEKSLGKRFGVQGYPTLKFFDGKSDKPEDYGSGRDLESLLAFVADKTGAKIKKKLEMPSNVILLSDTSFKEAINSDKNVLVAFTAPWCGHCKKLAPTWETLANDFAGEENVLIAKIDAEAANSKATTIAYGVTSYPTIKWFPAGSDKPEEYDGDRNEEDFIKFINEKAGTHRVVGGGLDDQAGTVPLLDSIVAKFSGGASLAEVAAETKKQAEALRESAEFSFAEYYMRVFDKLSASDNFVAKELVRLNGILNGGGLAPSKRDQIKSKINILGKFVQEKANEIKEKVEEKVNEVDEKVKEVKEKVEEKIKEVKEGKEGKDEL